MSLDSPNRSSCSVGRKGDGYMIGMFLQMWTANRRARFFRTIAGACVVLWVAGSVSTLYGSLTSQWTTPHCPQSHSNSAHHTHGSCAWHCEGINAQSSSGRSWGPSIAPTGFVFGHHSATLYAIVLNGGITSRGPPQPIFSRFVLAMLRGQDSHEEARTNKSGRMYT
jgi:hypothetical protein